MRLNVLIVDDSPAMRTFIRRVLELSGIELDQCLSAGEGREGIAVLEKSWVDLILTDINMPGMNGGAIMGDGRVGLILDVEGIFGKAKDA